jgi:peroxiredoxin
MRPAIRFLLVLVNVSLAVIGGFALRSALDKDSEQSPPSTAFVEAAALMQGLPRPSFALPDLNGVQHDVKEWDGKVLVLNFWATWCPPCREEIPGFIDLQTSYGEKGLQFVGVAIDGPKAAAKFVKDMGVNYPTLIGDSEAIKVAKSYGNQVGALPYTVVIDRQGRIAFVKLGEISRQDAEKAILALL